MEALPGHYTKSFGDLENDYNGSDTSIAHTGETHRQKVWSDELFAYFDFAHKNLKVKTNFAKGC